MAVKEIENLAELKTLIGTEVGVSDWFEVTQERINKFAEATNDWQWIHVDAERAAKESPFETTIAHGFLTVSLMSFLTGQSFSFRHPPRMGVNYGFNRVRFVSPVLVDSKIRLRLTLKNVEEIAGGAQIVWNATIESENGAKPNCVAEWLTRYYE